jgi:hypothetical protein
VGQGPVRAAGVVDAGEGVQEVLELGERGRLGGLGAQPFLQGLLESLRLALGLGVVRFAVLLPDSQAAQFGFQAVAAAFAAGSRVVKTMPLPVKVAAGAP